MRDIALVGHHREDAINCQLMIDTLGISLVVQWLRICASTTEGMGSIPGQGSSTCREVRPKKRNVKRKKIDWPSQWQFYSQYNKEFHGDVYAVSLNI